MLESFWICTNRDTPPSAQNAKKLDDKKLNEVSPKISAVFMTATHCTCPVEIARATLQFVLERCQRPQFSGGSHRLSAILRRQRLRALSLVLVRCPRLPSVNDCSQLANKVVNRLAVVVSVDDSGPCSHGYVKWLAARCYRFVVV